MLRKKDYQQYHNPETLLEHNYLIFGNDTKHFTCYLPFHFEFKEKNQQHYYLLKAHYYVQNLIRELSTILSQIQDCIVEWGECLLKAPEPNTLDQSWKEQEWNIRKKTIRSWQVAQFTHLLIHRFVWYLSTFDFLENIEMNDVNVFYEELHKQIGIIIQKEIVLLKSHQMNELIVELEDAFYYL